MSVDPEIPMGDVAEAVLEAYTPMGVGMWWQSYAAANSDQQARMAYGVLAEWSGSTLGPMRVYVSVRELDAERDRADRAEAKLETATAALRFLFKWWTESGNGEEWT